MALKTKESKHIPGLKLSELNGLQRLEYLEYISDLENELEEKQKTVSPAKITAVIASINIKAAARMFALSLSNFDADKDVSIEDVQDIILKEYGLSDINAASFEIRELSNMIAKPSNNESDDDNSNSQSEPVTAGKQ